MEPSDWASQEPEWSAASPLHGHASMVPPTKPLKFSVFIQWLVPYLP